MRAGLINTGFPKRWGFPFFSLNFNISNFPLLGLLSSLLFPHSTLSTPPFGAPWAASVRKAMEMEEPVSPTMTSGLHYWIPAGYMAKEHLNMIM